MDEALIAWVATAPADGALLLELWKLWHLDDLNTLPHRGIQEENTENEEEDGDGADINIALGLASSLAAVVNSEDEGGEEGAGEASSAQAGPADPEGEAEHASTVDAIEASWWEKHKCSCSPNCVDKLGASAKELTRAIAMMGRARRKDVVKAMLIPLTKLQENTNSKRKKSAGVKRKHSDSDGGGDIAISMDVSDGAAAGAAVASSVSVASAAAPANSASASVAVSAASSLLPAPAGPVDTDMSGGNGGIILPPVGASADVAALAKHTHAQQGQQGQPPIAPSTATLPQDGLAAGGTAAQGQVASRVRASYMMFGEKVCAAAFQALTMLSKKAISDILREVQDSHAPFVDTPMRAPTTKGQQSQSTAFALRFLESFAMSNACIFPTGRKGKIMALLPPELTKMSVYKEYCHSELFPQHDAAQPRAQRKKSMVQPGAALMSPSAGHRDEAAAEAADPDELRPSPPSPIFPLSYNSFTELWKKYLPWLRAYVDGGDLCESCWRIKGDPLLSRIHRSIASIERENYAAQVRASRESGGYFHITFNVADKVLLPHLNRLPSAMYFGARLSMDLFSVCNETVGEESIFCLPEGQWPMEKSSNTVISMLHHALESSSWSQKSRTLRKLVLHAGAGFGSGKSRWILYYLCWRVACGLEDDITLSCLLQGHDRFINDAGLALVKREMRKTDVITPHQLVDVVQRSTLRFNVPVPASRISWYDWKTFLSHFFDKRVSVSTHHVFKLQKSHIGSVWCQELSNSPETKEYPLMREGVSVSLIRASAPSLHQYPLLIKQLDPARVEFLTTHILPNTPPSETPFFAPL